MRLRTRVEYGQRALGAHVSGRRSRPRSAGSRAARLRWRWINGRQVCAQADDGDGMASRGQRSAAGAERLADTASIGTAVSNEEQRHSRRQSGRDQ